jgi:hypothetical protein
MRKKKPIVTNYLEKVAAKMLEEYPKLVEKYLGNEPGIYVLYNRRRFYYVGLAENLFSRLLQHRKNKHKDKWDSYSVYLTPKEGSNKELESLILRIFSPNGNAKGGRLTGANNLLRSLKRDMTEAEKDKHARLLGGSVAQQRMRSKVKRLGKHSAIKDTLPHALNLRASYKGMTYNAVLNTNGTIRCNKKVYSSPTAAGVALIQKSVNGRTFWKFKSGNKWVPLKNLYQ